MTIRSKFSWIARFFLVAYAVVMTAMVALAVTVGPFKESIRIWTQARLLETKFKESERERERLEEERDRLLLTIKGMQSDWTSNQKTIQALRQLVSNPENEQRLVEVNQLNEELSRERTVLITKLNDLRQAVQSCTDGKQAGTPP